MPHVCFLNSSPESFARATSPAGGPYPPAGEVAKPSRLIADPPLFNSTTLQRSPNCLIWRENSLN